MLNSILLVDDDVISNFINYRMISNLDIAKEVTLKLNGKEALKYIKDRCNRINSCPDLILLDLNMPTMNGLEFLEEYKKESLPNKDKIKIVVLSNMIKDEDQKLLDDYGIKTFLIKPITKEKIMEIIETV